MNTDKETVQPEHIPQLTLVKVSWLDAYGVGSEWLPANEIPSEPIMTVSIGLFLRASAEAVTLVMNHACLPNGEAHFCGSIVIPRCCIQHIKLL